MTFYFLGERLAVDLLNTVIATPRGEVRDLLAGPAAVAAWARAAGLGERAGPGIRSPVPAGEPRALRAFREMLRRGLVAWAAGRKPGRALVHELNRRLAADPEIIQVAVGRGRAAVGRRARGAPLDRVYGAVARSAAELLSAGDPGRLRTCANPACRLMFYDVSKAGRRRWCSMQACGARAKVRAFYRRRRAIE